MGPLIYTLPACSWYNIFELRHTRVAQGAFGKTPRDAEKLEKVGFSNARTPYASNVKRALTKVKE